MPEPANDHHRLSTEANIVPIPDNVPIDGQPDKPGKSAIINQAYKLWRNGNTVRKIAELTNTPKSTIHDWITNQFPDANKLDFYACNTKDVWQDVSARILYNLSDEDIKKASMRDKIVAAGIAYDKVHGDKGAAGTQVNVQFNWSGSPPADEVEKVG